MHYMMWLTVSLETNSEKVEVHVLLILQQTMHFKVKKAKYEAKTQKKIVGALVSIILMKCDITV